MSSPQIDPTKEESVGLSTSTTKLSWQGNAVSPRVQGLLQRTLGTIPNPSLVIRTLKRLLIGLLPSFIVTWLWQIPSRKVLPAESRSTDYVEGLRGFAAFTVVHKHLIQMLSTSAGIGWGHPGLHRELYKLPFIRIISGDAAISLFFIVSGYVLSISPILAMRKRPKEPEVFFRKLASSVVRRPVRLYIPVWTACFIVFLLVRLRYFEYLFALEDRYFVHFGGWVRPSIEWPPRLPSILAQFGDMLEKDANLLANFEDWRTHPWTSNYDSPAWTMTMSFRASIILYITHATVYFMERMARNTVLCILISFGLFVQAYEYPLYWMGCLLAESSPLIGALATPALSVKDIDPKPQKLADAFAVATLITGLWLSSYPGWGAGETPGYEFLSRISPWPSPIDFRFWTAIGGALVIFSLDRLAIVRRVFMLPALRYLGQISFSFWLMHLWIVHSIGLMAFHYAWSITGRKNEASNLIGFLAGYSIMWAAIIWVSDIFYRVVDLKASRVAQKMEPILFRDL